MSGYKHDGAVDFVDLFCGAGGSSLGLTAAGFSLRLAANHWRRAIETHAANFSDAEHWCEDINKVDMRRLPPARVLWASPICWEVSPSGGNAAPKLPPRGQDGLFDDDAEPVAADGMDRTRATCYDVIRATEVWRYDVVLIENVVELAWRWPLFWWWLDGMEKLGYRRHIVCINSAHAGGPTNPYAPQWRDRMYIVFCRDGIPTPDLEPRPLAYCFDCGEDVHARQTWKEHLDWGRARIGKYRDQYVYTCPNTTRRHEGARPGEVEPYVLPAAAAIDWTDLGPRIADRPRTPRKPEGLRPSTMARIRQGLAMVTGQPVVVQVNHSGPSGRPYPAGGAPLATRTVRGGDAFAVPPMLVPVGGTWNTMPTSVQVPMRTRTANPKGMEAIVSPACPSSPNVSPFVVEARGGGSTARPVAHPLGTITAGGNHHFLTTPPGTPADTGSPGEWGLVVPYRRGKAKTTGEPLHTVATHDSAGLLRSTVDMQAADLQAVDVQECRYRMLKAREHLRAQRFADDYIVKGKAAEQTMQAGNAVSANVAQWIGERVLAALT